MTVSTRELEIKHAPKKNRFYIALPSQGSAYLDYRLLENHEPSIMEFTHTFVTKSFRNQGIASKIVKHGLEYAREKGYEIKPICPFVIDYVKEHPEFQS